jgi:four helix bundle protein
MGQSIDISKCWLCFCKHRAADRQITKNKFQINPNQEMPNPKPVYDLEERTFQFAKRVRIFVRKLPKTIANIEDGKQLVRASGSVEANYIEANESLGKKDFLMRIKICRKEAKEAAYFLRLIYETNAGEYEEEGIELCNEAVQLKKIFSAILEKSK